MRKKKMKFSFEKKKVLSFDNTLVPMVIALVFLIIIHSAITNHMLVKSPNPLDISHKYKVQTKEEVLYYCVKDGKSFRINHKTYYTTLNYIDEK